MQITDQALHAKSRLPGVLTVLLLAVAAFGALAPAGNAQQRQEAFAGWGSYHAKGWSAGTVARGTGYWRPGASLRVREVQRRLNRLDYGAGKVDGLFGPITEAAVRSYQGDHALRLDGIVGPQTLADLRARTRRVQGLAESGRQPKGWSAGTVARGTGYWRPGASLRVREVQRRLNRLDYGAGKVDGLFGPITEAAVRSYQGDHALRLDGIVGPQTLADLRARTRRGEGAVDRRSTGRGRSSTGGPDDRRTRAPAASERTGSDEPLAPDVLVAAAVVALLIATLLARRARRLIGGAAVRLRARGRRADAQAVDGLYATAYVEGKSVDERIGTFRGFAYPARPMVGNEEMGSLLVYDPGKPRPVYARLSEITAINGRAVQPAGPPGYARGEQMESVPRRVPRTPGDGATVTLLSSRRSASAPSLRIVRRIEAPPSRKARSGVPPASARMSERHRGRGPHRFRWIGARVHLADAEGMDPVPGVRTVPVELELFAESEIRRWETGLVDAEQPLRVSVDDFEASVRAAVVPNRISQLAEALADAGVLMDVEELARLPFAVERSIEVERAIAGMEAYSIRAS